MSCYRGIEEMNAVVVRDGGPTGVLLSRQHSGLDGGAVGHGLVGMDAPGGLLAVEELLHQLLDLGDAGGASDQDDFVDVGLLQVRVVDDLLHGLHGGTEQILEEKENVQ